MKNPRCGNSVSGILDDRRIGVLIETESLIWVEEHVWGLGGIGSLLQFALALAVFLAANDDTEKQYSKERRTANAEPKEEGVTPNHSNSLFGRS